MPTFALMTHRLALSPLSLAGIFLVLTHGEVATCQESSEVPFLPLPVSEDAYEALQDFSPFRRTIDLSDSIVLTGIARIESDVYATLFDTETTESHVVSEIANSRGWQLVGVGGDEEDLESLTAKIQMDGGEVVSIRYEPLSEEMLRRKPGQSGSSQGKTQLSASQEEEAKRAAVNYRRGFSSDGYRDEIPREVLEKLSRIPVQQREAINRHMIGLRNQGIGTDERRQIYNGLLDRALRSRR